MKFLSGPAVAYVLVASLFSPAITAVPTVSNIAAAEATAKAGSILYDGAGAAYSKLSKPHGNVNLLTPSVTSSNSD